MVTFIDYGDIFKIEGVLNYAHGCNCSGAMGKGIATQFKKRFPEMYRQYKKLCIESKFNLGDVFEYNYGNGYVFNLGTQQSWRTKADITAIQMSLNKMLLFSSEKEIKKIAMPTIGAGLGGLKWESVKQVIESVAKNYSNIELLVVENYQP